jgi:hypothetical protein
MPNRYETLVAGAPRPSQAPAPSSGGRNRYAALVSDREQPDVPRRYAAAETPPVDATEGDGFPVGAAVVGGGALAGLGLLAKSGKLGKAAGLLGALRQQLMLSGFALPKSMLGNAGAAVEMAIERGTMRPIKEMLSKQTLTDAARAYKQNQGAVGAGANAPRGVTLPGPMPGRFMGAMDEASQGALKRAGMTADEAEAAVLQRPLTGSLAEGLDSDAARYLHPFRRTPFNQWLEGLKKMKGAQEGAPGVRRGMAVYGTAGFTHGAATSDDELPVSLPFAIAASARYGLPYGLAALAGRAMSGGKGTGSIPSNVIPVSEYGITQGILDPTKPFRKPAALSALEKMTGP